jgi:hypothetical protein
MANDKLRAIRRQSERDAKAYGVYGRYDNKSFGRLRSASAMPQIAGTVIYTDKSETRTSMRVYKGYQGRFSAGGKWYHGKLKYRKGVMPKLVAGGMTSSLRNSKVVDGKVERK